jgi:imidazole glycerol-phosphate synthase subunit HisH
MANVCILDYGSGNVRSVFNLLSVICGRVIVSNDQKQIQESSHIVLPGVGSFGAAMRRVRESIPMEALHRAVFADNKPFLGICVGMQIMADKGLEFGEFSGLGWIHGAVTQLQTNELVLPHIGWNSIRTVKSCPLLIGLEGEPDFYFVHSYAIQQLDPSVVAATTEYGEEFCSVVQSNNLFGVQFHPEKSQEAGRRLVENFLRLGA